MFPKIASRSKSAITAGVEKEREGRRKKEGKRRRRKKEGGKSKLNEREKSENPANSTSPSSFPSSSFLMSDPVEKQLYNAGNFGQASEVSSLLRDHPEIDVNWGTEETQWTLLHIASRYGHVEVVRLLLAHPDINVNLMNIDGQTPFSRGCLHGHVSIVQVMLKDPRIDVTLDDNYGRTPLWYASRHGKHEVIEWF